MKKPFTWGIIGGGFISHQFAEGLKNLSDVRIGAVASASHTGSPISAERYYNDYEQLAEDEEIDAIYIGTIHPRHFENICLCLQKKKPVLCEKPIVMHASQMECLLELSEKSGTLLMEAMWSRFLPLYVYLKEKIKKGEFGKIEHMKISFGEKAEPSKKRLFSADLGGGALMDIGVYGINLAKWLLEEDPKKIQSWARVNEEGVDLTTFCSMHFSDLCDVEMTVSIEKKLENSMWIMTDKGEYYIPYFWRPDTLFRFSPGQNFDMNCPCQKNVFEIKGNGYQYEAAAFQETVYKGELDNSTMPRKESLKVMKILDEIRENAIHL